LLVKRLEDLDYRINQYRGEGHQEARLRRRLDALLRSAATTQAMLDGLTRILRVEEGKLEQGTGLFHKGLERLMIEDLVAVENIEVFKSAGQYAAVRYRLSDIQEEVADIERALDARRGRAEHLGMLERWRADLFDELDVDQKAGNALLHQRLDAQLRAADLGDDLRDLSDAAEFLEAALSALEDGITAGTSALAAGSTGNSQASNAAMAQPVMAISWSAPRSSRPISGWINQDTATSTSSTIRYALTARRTLLPRPVVVASDPLAPSAAMFLPA